MDVIDLHENVIACIFCIIDHDIDLLAQVNTRSPGQRIMTKSFT